MPTRRGVATIVGGLALVGLGRLLGELELYVLGAVTVALVACSAAVVVAVRPSLLVEQHLEPAHVEAGDRATVRLSLHNRGRRRTPALTTRLWARQESASGQAWRHGSWLAGNVARVVGERLLEPIAPESRASVRLVVGPLARGVVRFGPVELLVEDGLGLARRSITATDVSEVVVAPAITAVPPPPRGLGGDPRMREGSATTRTSEGEEFFALRPYQPGDDLRRVHWASSARSSDLLVRQEETTWQHSICLALDLRRAVHDSDSFEELLAGAASLAAAATREHASLRVIATDRSDSGFHRGQEHLAALLDHLARVAPSSPEGMGYLLSHLAARPDGTVVVLTTDALPDLDAAHLGSLGLTGTRLLVRVHCAKRQRRATHAGHETPAPALVQPASARAQASATTAGMPGGGTEHARRTVLQGFRIVDVAPPATFAETWARALGTSSRDAWARRRHASATAGTSDGGPPR